MHTNADFLAGYIHMAELDDGRQLTKAEIAAAKRDCAAFWRHAEAILALAERRGYSAWRAGADFLQDRRQLGAFFARDALSIGFYSDSEGYTLHGEDVSERIATDRTYCGSLAGRLHALAHGSASK